MGVFDMFVQLVQECSLIMFMFSSMVDAAAETSIPNILESPRRGMSCSPTSPVLQPTPQPYLALLTTPIVIIPYSLIRCAKIIPGPM